MMDIKITRYLIQKTMFIHKFQNFIITLMLFVVLAACDRYTSILEQMDIAEGLMNTKPDSALAILVNIPVSNIKSKEIVARYALLKSMALDKNCIDTTTFDILQPAIDYYIENGSPDEQLRTYYYQGRIYQNQGDKDSAMQSFMRGKEYCREASDTLTMANLLVAQATIQYSTYKIDDFIKTILMLRNYTETLTAQIMKYLVLPMSWTVVFLIMIEILRTVLCQLHRNELNKVPN